MKRIRVLLLIDGTLAIRRYPIRNIHLRREDGLLKVYTMKRALVLLMLVSVMCGQTSDNFFDRWEKFRGAMNDYIEGLNSGVNRRDRLTVALREWRRMYSEQGWEHIK